MWLLKGKAKKPKGGSNEGKEPGVFAGRRVGKGNKLKKKKKTLKRSPKRRGKAKGGGTISTKKAHLGKGLLHEESSLGRK